VGESHCRFLLSSSVERTPVSAILGRRQPARPRSSRGTAAAVPGVVRSAGDLLTPLKYVTQERIVTFVYAASDEERNSAVPLKELLERGKK
jgi:hypothetical protein